ncbi:MAG TPA: glycosyltransferase family 39 protein [Deltaproteobacteria bacterium]|nr:glycosyltransferase family 39 protein [Deltaproteobacteria bacterium]HPP81499.1 glycosyltransferase family 39 protein [Deltaproteobacteria bacterium]
MPTDTVSGQLKIFCLALVISLSLVGIFDHSLWTPDEPRVAEIGREMVLSRDYLIPHLSKEPFLEHPPLYYALVGMSYHLFGTGNEGAGRIPSVLFGLSTLLITYVSTKRLYSEKTALLATLILAGTAEFLVIHHKIIVDAALCFFISAAMMSFILAYMKKFPKGYLAFWSALALSFLTKGLVGVAIPVSGVILFLLWQRDFSEIRRIRVIPGVALLACAAILWGVVLHLRGGTDFLHTFFIYNQFGRFFSMSGYTGGHLRPWYYYFFSIFTDSAPWSLLLLASIPGFRTGQNANRFMASWVLGGFILLSLSATKRGIYFLPMYPALSVIIAQTFADLTERAGRWWDRWALRITAGAIVLAGLAIPYIPVKFGNEVAIVPLAAYLFLLIFFCWWFFRKQTALTVVLLWCITVLFWSPFIIPVVDKEKSYREFYRQAGAMVSDGQVIGYGLNETVEAYSPFYGGFYVLNFKDPEHYSRALRSMKTGYALVMDGHGRKEDMDYLMQRAKPVLRTKRKYLRGITLWKIRT